MLIVQWHWLLWVGNTREQQTQCLHAAGGLCRVWVRVPPRDLSTARWCWTPRLSLTFWELKDCVQWYRVSLEWLGLATAASSPPPPSSFSAIVSRRAAVSSWGSETLSDAIFSVSVLAGGKWGHRSAARSGGSAPCRRGGGALLFPTQPKEKLTPL